MAKTCVAFPVLPGKEDMAAKELPDYSRAHMDEYAESRGRAGITLERVYGMHTPMGYFNILYSEGAGGFVESILALTTSDLDFDKYSFGKIQEITGIDFTQPPPGPPPELVGEWWDPTVTERRPGLAFCVPVMPGKSEAARAFAREAFVNRVAEHAESRRALGINGEVVFLQPTPMGDLVCAYLEGNDPVAGNRKFAASQSPYDRWFKDQLAEVFPPDISFDEPVPPVEQLFEWSAAPAAVG
ncbi:MAG: hypothetical protein M3O87_02675 [Candidatus Dormibacteraeota bacterium]|nr:hypothetical protein [Candidatus Dormibacteraeota bacterium]